MVLRPNKLSVTEIETWLRDPYAIYAKHVLKLRPLDALDQETDAADYGQVVHAGLHRFLCAHGTAWPPNAAALLREALSYALSETQPREALRAWWSPRLDRIAAWVAETEATRRATAPPLAIASEAEGIWRLPIARGFDLTGRADRLELRAEGRLAILDYKTGTPPSQTEVEAGLAPQLLLEAAMAEAGAFKGVAAARATELIYWQLSGGFDRGSSVTLFKGDAAAIEAAVAEAASALQRLIATFDDPARAYLSHPHPARTPRFAEYAQLARVAEWSAGGDGE